MKKKKKKTFKKQINKKQTKKTAKILMKTNFIKDLDLLVQHKLYQGFRPPCPTQTLSRI